MLETKNFDLRSMSSLDLLNKKVDCDNEKALLNYGILFIFVLNT